MMVYLGTIITDKQEGGLNTSNQNVWFAMAAKLHMNTGAFTRVNMLHKINKNKFLYYKKMQICDVIYFENLLNYCLYSTLYAMYLCI